MTVNKDFYGKIETKEKILEDHNEKST